jgi:hypothetical protein
MILLTDTLRQKRQQYDMIPEHIAAFLGISSPGYWDLESDPDEWKVLDVSAFLRLCVLFEIPPSLLLIEDDGNGRGTTPDSIDSPEVVQVAAYLRNRCEELSWVSEVIGWENAALSHWLSDDLAFGQMPMAALKDLTAHLGVEMIAILNLCWQALRRR